MQLRKTLILVGVALALVAFIVVFERHTASTDKSDILAGRAFPNFAGKAGLADAVAITRGPDKIVLVKRDAGTADERWHITQPIDYRADASRVIAFLDAFEKATKTGMEGGALEKTLVKTADVTPYGLDKAVRVVVSAGKERLLDALIGGHTPSKKHVYAAPYERDKVFALDEKVGDEARRHLNEFRDKRLVDLARGRVTNVVILENEKPVAELARGPAGGREGRWAVVYPVSDRADKARADQIVDRMGSLWADRFEVDFAIDDTGMPRKLAVFALVPSRRSVKITREVGGQIVRHEILFGKRMRKTETGRRPSYDVYAMIAGSRTVVLVPEASLEVIPRDPNDLRDRRVAAFRADEVTSLTVSRFAGKLELDKKDGRWQIVGLSEQPERPERPGADKERVEGLLKELTNIRALKFLPFDTHLTRPILVQAVVGPPDQAGAEEGAGEGEGPAGERRKELIFFEPDDAPPRGGETIRARRGRSGAVFEVPAAILGRLQAGPLHYRDRTVHRLDDGKVAKLTITSGGASQSAVREADKWKADPTSASAGAEIDQFLAHEVKWALCELRAEEFVGKPGARELQRHGLDPAEVRVEVELDPEKRGEPPRRVVLLVGRQVKAEGEDADKTYYAKLEDDPMVFLLGENVVKNLRTGFVKGRQ